MLLVAVDGACRRNGEPDCTSAGGVFMQYLKDGTLVRTETCSIAEQGSTNQRGELHALLYALGRIRHQNDKDVIILTDSEYLFNAMTKDWPGRWDANGWQTAAGESVKNADIWKNIRDEALQCPDIAYYHIKGHVISFGKVTAGKLLDLDTSGEQLLREVYNKYDTLSLKPELVQMVNDLSTKNNGFAFSTRTFRDFVVANTVVDAVATKAVEAADRNI